MKWQPHETIPMGRMVYVRTVTGIDCVAITQGQEKWTTQGGVRCFRRDRLVSSDVVAVQWKEIPQKCLVMQK